MTEGPKGQEDFTDLVENFNHAMIEADPKDVHLDAPDPLRVDFVKLHAALRHNTTWMAEQAVGA